LESWVEEKELEKKLGDVLDEVGPRNWSKVRVRVVEFIKGDLKDEGLL